jgi:zinc protease
MYQFEPAPNLGRHQQIFQIWVRPVEPPNAGFALRLALFELNRLVKDGMSDYAASGTFWRRRSTSTGIRSSSRNSVD